MGRELVASQVSQIHPRRPQLPQHRCNLYRQEWDVPQMVGLVPG